MNSEWILTGCMGGCWAALYKGCGGTGIPGCKPCRGTFGGNTMAAGSASTKPLGSGYGVALKSATESWLPVKSLSGMIFGSAMRTISASGSSGVSGDLHNEYSRE